MQSRDLFDRVWPVVERARNAILDVYASGDFSTEEKSDHSPVTRADQASHGILWEGLSPILPKVPVISEEMGHGDPPYPAGEGLGFWLVDPLDGTKEFIRKNGEFTINVALVDKMGFPLWGLVDVPLKARTYVGGLGSAFWVERDHTVLLPTLRHLLPQDARRVALSRSHQGTVDEWLKGNQIPVAELVYAGSAVKFCWVADGSVDLYVRLLPTMGWDTAAGQALIEAVGGSVVTLDGKRLNYHPFAEVNPSFVASAPVDHRGAE